MDNLPKQNPLTFDTPIFGGIVGAAQLSTACLLRYPSSGTDFLLTGAVSVHFLWSVPLGALLGIALCWVLLRLPPHLHSRSVCCRTWAYATVVGFLAAPLAPGLLGLGRQTAAQLWEGFTIIYSCAWLCVGVATQLERWIKRQQVSSNTQ